MSLLTNWLKQVNPPSSPGLGLPDPRAEVSLVKAKAIEAANTAVEQSVSVSRKRKRGDYNFYSDEVRAKIGRSALENGVMKTVRKFSKDLGKNVSESSVRSMRDSYVRKQKQDSSSIVTALPKGQRGQPLLIG
ncbi:uncharacterized protein LOC102800823, partial [Saccoglossus kowalevskii]|uniref:Uncharacterized protein LOC102800823 n=1 Tax=Saccoglossus kowalevskii TaxID=10224 RepID=A0ABM0MHP2_SACKO